MDATVIECCREGPRQWIRVTGRATMRDAPRLREALVPVTSDAEAVWLDLALASHLDSTVMGCLVGLARKAAVGEAPELVLNNPSTGCLTALRMLKLDKVLRIERQPAPQSGWIPTTCPVPTRDELAQAVVNAHQQLAEQDPGNATMARIAKAFTQARSTETP